MISGSWSGMRKYLEQEMLADCLKGRVRYNCTTYTGMDDCKIFEGHLNGQWVKYLPSQQSIPMLFATGCG